ncbi:hypothetical protein [Dyadobacter pollutisoli]|uniref:Uncharacterized protein n=1 Tax=Dyadobacter pollutisoli TaxID=2910158 RepID=A0A9E8N9F6_9BACT|nr:hypothetical protein [Dyadobacter pollutisoli]WAC12400.1 hypothetical protein ON006_00265 [Dyadobacter pollutisoli]
MNCFSRFFLNILLIVPCLIVVGSCQNKEVDPIVKESIDGEIKKIQIDIFLRGIGGVYMDILDKTDGKLYEVNLVERGGTPYFNSFAYIDSTDLILPETKEVPFGLEGFTTAFAVNPIRSTNNEIHITYDDNDSDPRFSTKGITGQITPNTILIISSLEEDAIAILRTNEGIQRFLKPILLDGLNNNFAKDINYAQDGDQVNRFLIYTLRINSGREF